MLVSVFLITDKIVFPWIFVLLLRISWRFPFLFYYWERFIFILLFLWEILSVYTSNPFSLIHVMDIFLLLCF